MALLRCFATVAYSVVLSQAELFDEYVFEEEVVSLLQSSPVDTMRRALASKQVTLDSELDQVDKLENMRSDIKDALAQNGLREGNDTVLDHYEDNIEGLESELSGDENSIQDDLDNIEDELTAIEENNSTDSNLSDIVDELVEAGDELKIVAIDVNGMRTAFLDEEGNASVAQLYKIGATDAEPDDDDDDGDDDVDDDDDDDDDLSLDSAHDRLEDTSFVPHAQFVDEAKVDLVSEVNSRPEWSALSNSISTSQEDAIAKHSEPKTAIDQLNNTLYDSSTSEDETVVRDGFQVASQDVVTMTGF